VGTRYCSLETLEGLVGTMQKFLQDYRLFNDIYRKKRVLVTGHTGFKGSWFCTWLAGLGAEVLGFSLAPMTEPSHFDLFSSKLPIESVIGDIRDLSAIQNTIMGFQPVIVFHMAAQSLVRQSYEQPIETLHTNVIGSANVFEACRHTPSVRAIINVTSDKCYDNREWVWGYRENDPLGGYDPYSASKACAELVASAYRNSFFQPGSSGEDRPALLASVRAGNVIGGGDWAKDRLVTDIMEATHRNEPFTIRNPSATRPWQHVLEPLSGYLLLGQRLLENQNEFAASWNFGPNDSRPISVRTLVHAMQNRWNRIRFIFPPDDRYQPHEAKRLKLDCSKAVTYLHWNNVWNAPTAIHKTVDWYRGYYEHNRLLTKPQLAEYVKDAEAEGLCWAKRLN